MCGFLGFVNFDNIKPDNLKEISNKLHHRGPDDSSQYIDNYNKIYFTHSRLSIIDISRNGIQPMCSKSGRFILMFNGEIYNFKFLKNKYLKNYNFKSTSDTEVLLALIELYGFFDTIKKLEGMFAISLYDKKLKKIYLAKDRFGEKPLYYFYKKNINQFFFTSDLIVLSKTDLIYKEINNEALDLYFKYNYIPSPLSIYKDIYKLEPGSILEFSIDKNTVQHFNYFKSLDLFEEKKIDLNFDNATLELEKLLVEKIENQLIADVPLGTFLSGGIDSTLITSIIAKKFNQNIDAFTIGFDNKEFDETKKSKKIANYLKINHHVEILNKNHIIDILEKLPHFYSEPFADSSQIPTFFLSQIASKKVKVSLSGDGGDELFGGYNRYLFSIKYLDKLNYIPLSLRILISKMMLNINKFNLISSTSKLLGYNKKYAYFNNKIEKIIKVLAYKNNRNYYDLLTTNDFKDLIINKKTISLNKFNPILNQINFNENIYDSLTKADLLTYLPDDILCKVDRASMANSLEIRSPFLNHKIANFAINLPQNYKINKNDSKIILKNILNKFLPSELINSPKHGFTFPLNFLIKNDLYEYFYDNLSSSNINEYFNKNKLLNLLKQHNPVYNDNSSLLWSILVFKRWLDSK